jgi:ribosomal protein S17E
LNKIRRVAEQLVERYPTLFTSDFEKNKQALATVSIVHTRSLRNQLAGAITKLIHERGPTAEPVEELTPATGESLLEERLNAERETSDESDSGNSGEPKEASGSTGNAMTSENKDEREKQTISEAAV